MSQYKIYKSEAILSDPEGLVSDCKQAHKIFNESFNVNNVKDFPTQSHYTDVLGNSTNVRYNFFMLSATSLNFYNVYRDLSFAIRDFLGTDQPLWLCSWLNADSYTKTLDWHHHESEYHGYISIDPKQSNTMFEEWTVHNEIGNIYIGPGTAYHKIEVLQPYEGYRYTIGFDIITEPNKINWKYCPIPIT